MLSAAKNLSSAQESSAMRGFFAALSMTGEMVPSGAKVTPIEANRALISTLHQ